MKITIDTKEDSHAEIKKVISLLTYLVGEIPPANTPIKNIFDDSKPTEETGNLFNIFDQKTPEKKTDPEETPKIIPY